MARTYPHRRGWILEDTRSVVDIITETPLLKKNIYVSLVQLNVTSAEPLKIQTCLWLVRLLQLHKFCHFQATQEFGLITDRPNVREHFDEDFMKWAVAVIKYSNKTQVKNSAIQMVASQYSEDTSAGKFGQSAC